jgi:hypothetical protein
LGEGLQNPWQTRIGVRKRQVSADSSFNLEVLAAESASKDALAERGLDCCQAFGEVIREGESAVVGCFQVSVQADALAVTFGPKAHLSFVVR